MEQSAFNNYLKSSVIIDWKHPDVFRKAQELSLHCSDDAEIARQCYEFVRDEIYHSWDYKMNPVTLKASDVLKYQTGYCYAKSHLLAALLRANRIPAGLCYQRLILDDFDNRFCLHGLNAVYLKKHGWYRIDARGKITNIHADFTPPFESLAFEPAHDGEADLPEILDEPLPAVIAVLSTSTDYEMVMRNLPDI
jgi:transglutaminase-like putative cysteine protease